MATEKDHHEILCAAIQEKRLDRQAPTEATLHNPLLRIIDHRGAHFRVPYLPLLDSIERRLSEILVLSRLSDSGTVQSQCWETFLLLVGYRCSLDCSSSELFLRPLRSKLIKCHF